MKPKIVDSSNVNTLKSDCNITCANEDEFHSFTTIDTSIGLDHNYSYTKTKIDKSILDTPKSVVKADEDGGFLKVLSEIALVKAEMDNNKMDENKENKGFSIPEIKIINATPEKLSYQNVSKGITNDNSLNNIRDKSNKSKSKLHKDNLKIGKKNSNSVCETDFLNKENYQFDKNVSNKGNSWPISLKLNKTPLCEKNCDNKKNKSNYEDYLITLEESKKEIKTPDSIKEFNEVVTDVKKESPEIIENNKLETYSANLTDNRDLNIIKNDKNTINKNISVIQNVNIEVKNNYCYTTEVEKKSCHYKLETEINETIVQKNVSVTERKFQYEIDKNVQENLSKIKNLNINSKPEIIIEDSEPNTKKLKTPTNYRFSKDARKILEVLKNNSTENSFNVTISELELENDEIPSVLSESLLRLDESMILKNYNLPTVNNETPIMKNNTNTLMTPNKQTLTDSNIKDYTGSKVKFEKNFNKPTVQPESTKNIKKNVRRLPVLSKIPASKSKFLFLLFITFLRKKNFYN